MTGKEGGNGPGAAVFREVRDAPGHHQKDETQQCTLCAHELVTEPSRQPDAERSWTHRRVDGQAALAR